MIATPREVKDSTSAPVFPRRATDESSLALTNVFRIENIVTIPSSLTKAGVIGRLVCLLVDNHRLDASRAEAITEILVRRESYGSTAIGKGLAFPHLRTSDVQSFTGAIGVATEGLNFDALDHEPTKLVFLILSPIASREKHMTLLCRLVSLMRDKAISMQLHHRIQTDEIYRYLQDLDDQSQASRDHLAAIPGNETND